MGGIASAKIKNTTAAACAGRHGSYIKRGTAGAYRTPITLPKHAAHADKPKRNPFLPPQMPKRHYAVQTPTPVLKGIVQNGNARMAIIEYAGQSGYYESGAKIGGYTVSTINGSGVQLTDGSKTLTLQNGGADHD